MAQRIYEVVTRTGLAAGEDVKTQGVFPLGSDAQGYVEKNAGDWAKLSEVGKAIAVSTDIKE